MNDFCLKRCRKVTVDEYVEENEEEVIVNRINVSRPVYTEPNFNKVYKQNEFKGFQVNKEIKNELTKHFGHGKNSVKKMVYNRLPIVKWLKDYRIRENFLADILAGLLVGILQIPQGLAFSLLATLPAVNGLYNSFFPVFIYVIFASSRQNTYGTVAIVALLTGNAITDLSSKYVPPDNFNDTANEYNKTHNLSFVDTSNFLSLSSAAAAKTMLGSGIAFWIGVIYLIMFICQLGFITQYLTEPFVNSFTCAYAIHVLTSQLKPLFGLKLKAYVGAFKIPKTWINFFELIGQTNATAVIISIICITILLVIRIHINERFQKKLPVPVPTELFIVIFGTIISYYGKLPDNFNITVIGPIPAGIPSPAMPYVGILGDVFGTCIVIAIIAYSITFSLGDIFAKKHKYKLNPTQELLAAGACNIFGSFFNCFPCGSNIAGSNLQDLAGGKTQLASVVSALFILVILLVIGPLFEKLPLACLAAIIVSTLKNSLLQITQLSYYWRTNKIEFLHYLVTFLATLILDIDYGLYIGVGFYIVINTVRQSQPNVIVLGNLPNTELYEDVNLFTDAKEFEGIKIIKIEESLHSSNAAFFKKKIYEFTNTKPQEYLAKKLKIERKKKREATKTEVPALLKYVPQFIKNIFPGCFKNEELSSKKTVHFENPNFKNGQVNKTFELDKNNSKTSKATQSEYPEADQDANEVSETESQIDSNEIKVVHDYATDRTNKIKPNDKYSDLSSDEDDYGVLAKPPYHHIIIDFSSVSYIDTFAVKTLYRLIMDYQEINVVVFLANCNDGVRDRFKVMRKEFRKLINPYIPKKILHVTVHDAVLHSFDKFNRKAVAPQYPIITRMPLYSTNRPIFYNPRYRYGY